MTIRRMEERDLAQAAALERECFADPWPESSLRGTANGPAVLCLVAEERGAVLAYCAAQAVLDEGEILRIAVRRDSRRRRLASRLLEEVRRSRPEVAAWYLEVRAGNAAAAALYNRNGFVQTGVRRNYYDSPAEDAVLMVRKTEVENA